MSSAPVQPAQRQPLPVVVVEAARCPECGSMRYRVNGTHYKRDAMGERIEKYCTCRTCEKNFKVVAD